MKSSLFVSTFLVAIGTRQVIAQNAILVLPPVPVPIEIKIERVDKAGPVDDEDPEDDEEWDDEEEDDGSGQESGEEPEIAVDPGPDGWFPGGWNPDWIRRGGGPDVIFYTMTDGDPGFDGDDPVLYPYDEVIEIDPVIYQTGVPVGPKLSRKDKKAALEADIAAGCEVTFTELDLDGNGSLSAVEFSTRRPGGAKPNGMAFRRADKNRDGRLSFPEFYRKGSVPLVMPAAVNFFEAAGLRASFNSIDFDGNGFLTFGEFTALLRPSGPGILEKIFAEANRNGDGKISFTEYTHRQVHPAGVE